MDGEEGSRIWWALADMGGGRVLGRHVFGGWRRAGRCRALISPLEGEMPGRAEGGGRTEGQRGMAGRFGALAMRGQFGVREWRIRVSA